MTEISASARWPLRFGSLELNPRSGEGEAVGDSAESPRFIQTVPKRGYRFSAPVEDGFDVRVTAPARRRLIEDFR